MEQNHETRQQRRDRIQDNEFLRPGVTPVLLIYQNADEQEVFLIPASVDEVEGVFKVLNGFLGNGHIRWNSTYEMAHKYVQDKMYDPETGLPGEWVEKYLVDCNYTIKEEGKRTQFFTLPPIYLPPGTMVVQTGCL